MLGRGATRRVATEASSGSTWYLLRFLEEQRLQFLQLVGIGRGNVVGLRPVLGQVVEFPRHVVEGILVDRPGDVPRRADHFRAGDPAFVIDGVVAHHLEVLRLVRGRRFGVGLVEGVGEAHAFDRRFA